MVEIIFEPHSTTLDNENHISSGHNDVALSELGVKQSGELGARRGSETFTAVFCSDLQRSYKTAAIAFGHKFPIIQDPRLRECDYGDLTCHPSSEVDAAKPLHITTPFPHGESYGQAAVRMGEFLKDLKSKYDGRRVLIIGHRATQYSLEHWIKGVSVTDAVSAPWTWQPGWTYFLT